MRRATAAFSIMLVTALVVSSCATACGCTTLVTILTASSLANPVEAFAEAFPPTYGAGVVVNVSTGSSAALRTQIEQGARADVFLSADTTNPQALVDAGLTDGPARSFATNLLTIVVPEGNPGGLTSPADLARRDVTIVGAGEEVPITQYAVQLVNQLAALPGYPPDFAAAYEANIATREDNVGAVTAKIKLGEGDAAVVYATDAKAAGLQSIAIPSGANVVATYSGVVLKDSPSPHAAQALLDWIWRRNGQQILASYGFQPAP